MKKIIIVLDIIAFIGSLLWLVFKPDFEPLISTATTLVVLLGLIFIKSKGKKPKTPPINMKQKAGKKSTQYQSAGDMTISK